MPTVTDPENVIDGSVANKSRWVSRGTRGLTDGSDPHWLLLEFDSPLSFDRVQLITGHGTTPPRPLPTTPSRFRTRATGETWRERPGANRSWWSIRFPK